MTRLRVSPTSWATLPLSLGPEVTPSTYEVSAVSWEGFRSEPVFTSPMGAVVEAQKLMDAGDYQTVTIKDEPGQTVTEWVLVAGKWIALINSEVVR